MSERNAYDIMASGPTESTDRLCNDGGHVHVEDGGLVMEERWLGVEGGSFDIPNKGSQLL